MDIIKTIKKNILKILILSTILTVLAYLVVSYIQVQKITVNIYVNEKYIKEMNDDAKYILSSHNFNSYLIANSKMINKVFSKVDENELSKNILVEKPISNESTLKITFTTKDKQLGKEFAYELVNLSNSYIKDIQFSYFSKMSENLEKQYNELNKRTNIIEYRDAQADTTISKLVFYKQIKEDKNDVVRLTNVMNKGKYNKKIILLAAFLLGFVLIIFKEEIEK
ncbi:YveK family protein [Caviibacter abscessus]|uniref:hypothetical protein n=1 Tax=Caviibacter abscessus TaxID=1766719 RepID=UPI000829B30A|nr:hypothetical protein [Caviibacter abscessus]